jgi:methylthioribose-1-phosphate isomerase
MNQEKLPELNDTVRALLWDEQGLKVLDQRKLPEVLVYDFCDTSEKVAEAIRTMRVRGAPAIGIAAAYGVVLAAKKRYQDDPLNWKSTIEEDFRLLAGSRPTAVNLFWALERMHGEVAKVEGEPSAALLEAAETIHREDVEANRLIGSLGADLLAGATGLLTHCNTGSLATGGYGTALGVIRTAYQRFAPHIFATETRPWMQGSRLTVWELEQDRIPATLIADSAAASLMRLGGVQWVITGADRIAANGDTANKIGTYALAVAARFHGVRFMVVAPCSTVDFETATGAEIEIEERNSSELLQPYFQNRDTLVSAFNPVFDVTPAALIDAIVTERGVVLKPDSDAMQKLRP